MANHSPRVDLLICEYGGTPRSGKGTIVSHLAHRYDRVATEETGLVYRAVTKTWMSEGRLTPGMSKDEALAAIGPDNSATSKELAGITSNVQALIDQYGKEAFYDERVDSLVGFVGQSLMVRKAVKSTFTNRVEKARDRDDIDVLLVDGRNLIEVVKNIARTKLLLRTFVVCSPLEAALRQCTIEGVDLTSERGSAILAINEDRAREDEQRSVDAVKPDQDAIDYWAASDMPNSPEARALLNCTDPPEYQKLIAGLPERRFTSKDLCKGVGELAVNSGRQILLNTNVFRLYKNSGTAKDAMLVAAYQMFEEALAA